MQQIQPPKTTTRFSVKMVALSVAGLIALSGAAVIFLYRFPVRLTISSVQATNITHQGATISWTTNRLADSTVEYGALDQCVSNLNSTSSTLFTTSHNIALTNLLADTLIYFRVRSADSSGRVAYSGCFSFRTLRPEFGPAIGSITVTSISPNGATINWLTDVPADSTVEYGLTTDYGSVRSETTLVINHSVDLVSLGPPGATIHYRVTSRTSDGRSSSSPDHQFTLPIP